MFARVLHRDVCTECALAANCALRTPVGPRHVPCGHFVRYTGHGDICSACDSFPDCPGVGTVDHPVLHCEEFSASPRPQRSSRLPVAEVERPVPVGLCADCDCRETCHAARPEGGVWHCAEYR